MAGISKGLGDPPHPPHVRYVAGQFFRIRPVLFRFSLCDMLRGSSFEYGPYSSDSLCAICCGAVLSNTARTLPILFVRYVAGQFFRIRPVLFRFSLCDMLRGSFFEYGRTLPIPFVRYVAGAVFFEYGRTLPIPFVLHVMGQLAGAPLAICNFVVVALREFRCFCGGVLCFL